MRTYYTPNSLNGYLDQELHIKIHCSVCQRFFHTFFVLLRLFCDMIIVICDYWVIWFYFWQHDCDWNYCAALMPCPGVAKKNKSNVHVDKQNNCLLSNTAVKNCTKWWLMFIQQAVKIRFNFSDILTERSVTIKTRLWKAKSARLVNIYLTRKHIVNVSKVISSFLMYCLISHLSYSRCQSKTMEPRADPHSGLLCAVGSLFEWI